MANVGQGGRLFEYRDEKIEPRYRAELWEGIKAASLKSIATQQKYMEANRKYIIDSYLEIHSEFADEKDAMTKSYTDSLGCADTEVKYEMGDYMSLFLLDKDDMIERVYDSNSEQVINVYDRKGRPSADVNLYLDDKEIELVDKKGIVKRIEYFDKDMKPCGIEFTYKNQNRQRAGALVVVKVEPNPGAGLWRPHNDRLKLCDKDGQGCYKVFENLGQWAKKFRDDCC